MTVCCAISGVQQRPNVLLFSAATAAVTIVHCHQFSHLRSNLSLLFPVLSTRQCSLGNDNDHQVSRQSALRHSTACNALSLSLTQSLLASFFSFLSLFLARCSNVQTIFLSFSSAAAAERMNEAGRKTGKCKHKQESNVSATLKLKAQHCPPERGKVQSQGSN